MGAQHFGEDRPLWGCPGTLTRALWRRATALPRRTAPRFGPRLVLCCCPGARLRGGGEHAALQRRVVLRPRAGL
eukprot:14586907-Alexandrium_andersonii.AAC.1